MPNDIRSTMADMAALVVRLPEIWIKALQDISGWSQNKVEKIINLLEQDGLIRKEESCLLSVQDENLLARLAALRDGRSLRKGEEGTFFEFLFFEETGKYEAAIRTLLNLHGRLRSNGREASPALLFHIFLQELARHIPQENSNSEKRFFIDLCIDIQPGYYAKPDDLQRFLYFLQQARVMAQSLGDRRSEILLHLALGATSLQCRSQAYRPDIRKIMQQGAVEVQKLGDQDIMSRVAPYMYSYNFFCGNFQRILGSASFLPVTNVHSNGENRHVEATKALFRSSCLAAMGKFSQAVDMLQRACSAPFLRESGDIGLLLRIHLAFLLLASGRMTEVQPYIEEVRQELANEPFDFCHTGIAGAEAYLRYLQGEIQESYAVYRKAVEASTKKGTAFWSLYFAPWLLEMCVRYHHEGLPPLPGKEIEDVLFYQAKGVSRMVQTIALRLSAEDMLFKNEHNLEACKVLCQQGLTIAQGMNIPGETAKLYCLMARLLLKEGYRGEARKQAIKAAQALKRTQEVIHWPKELVELGIVPQKNDAPTPDETAEGVLARYLQAMLTVNSATSLDEAYDKIVSISTTELGMNKGGLYSRHAKTNTLQCLSWKQIDSSDTSLLSQSSIQQAFESAPRVISMQDRDKEGKPRFIQTYFIPFYCEDNMCYVLCHETNSSTGNAVFMDEFFLRSIAETLSGVLTNVRKVCAKINEYRDAVGSFASQESESVSNIIYSGAEMENVLRQAQSVAETDASVLIMGESGVGKELVARYIHQQSGRTGAFVAVNLSSIPTELFESELFGHEKGAFTGAHTSKVGFLELAHQGTVFLDEIGDVSLHFQVKLLRVLQEKCFTRVGGRQSIQSDFRLVCATNRNIKALIESREFREDFFYRICVMPLLIPPLRNRPGDILHLAEHFISIFAHHYKRFIPERLSVAQANMLLSYSWPGNVRELRNIVERAAILYRGGELRFSIPGAETEKIKKTQNKRGNSSETERSEPVVDMGLLSHKADFPMLMSPDILRFADFFRKLPTLEDVRRYYIRYVLEQTKGIIDGPSGAAEILGLSRASVYKALKKYHITAKDIRGK